MGATKKQGSLKVMPIDSGELDTLAAKLLSDYDSHNPGTVFAEGLRLAVTDAWRLGPRSGRGRRGRRRCGRL